MAKRKKSTEPSVDSEAAPGVRARGVLVSGVDRKLWRQLRAEAVMQGVPTGALLTEAIKGFLGVED